MPAYAGQQQQQRERKRRRASSSTSSASGASSTSAASRSSTSASSSSASSDSSDEAAQVQEQPDKKHHSLKASYLAKVMSPVIGYGSDRQLAQFVYDLWLWTSIGGAKNTSGVNLRVAIASKSFSPEYWKTWHAGLVDLQRQLGYPTLFVTHKSCDLSARCA